MCKAVGVNQDPQPGKDRASDRADRSGGDGGHQRDRQNGAVAPQTVACEQAVREASDHSSVRHEDCVCRRSAARECENCNLAQQRCGTDECIHHTRCTALEEPSHQRFSIGRAEREACSVATVALDWSDRSKTKAICSDSATRYRSAIGVTFDDTICSILSIPNVSPVRVASRAVQPVCPAHPRRCDRGHASC